MKRRYDFDKMPTKVKIIDCLECEHYYTGACDGGAGGCCSYTPTRKITMDEDIKTIKKWIKALWGTVLALFAVVCAIGVILL